MANYPGVGNHNTDNSITMTTINASNNNMSDINTDTPSTSEQDDDVPDLIELEHDDMYQPARAITTYDADWAQSQHYMRLYAHSLLNPNDPNSNAALHEARYWYIATSRPDLAHAIYDLRRGVTSALPDIHALANNEDENHIPDPIVNLLHSAHTIDTDTRLQTRLTATPYEIGRMIAFNAALIQRSTRTNRQ
jgi:hypothetical protein